jgi:ribonuclease PH
MRKIQLTPNYTRYAEGSALIEFGHTKVICTASLEPAVPKWLQGSGKGWVSSEYGMLPRSTHTRMKRDNIATGGRTQEISRLIGRSLRAVVDMAALGEKSIFVDCDVIQADGGTRTAAITGGFVALALALNKLKEKGVLSRIPLTNYVAAVSVGLGSWGPLLDLNYEEDSAIDTDMNFVMTGKGEFVELQGTAEKQPFNSQQLVAMSELANKGCQELFTAQEAVIGSFFKRALL